MRYGEEEDPRVLLEASPQGAPQADRRHRSPDPIRSGNSKSEYKKMTPCSSSE